MDLRCTIMTSVSFCLPLLLLLPLSLTLDDRCSSSNCQPPSCRCPGHNIPGGFEPEEVPQMVLITFDDAVNWDNWDFYLRLFPPDGSRRNPNGCPAAATLFVSNNFTDYCMVRKLHGRGLEIADHSLTHRLPHAWWAEASRDDIENEIVTQRHNLAELADIPATDIRGWRSPFLQPSGDNMFEVLYENNFTYDATMTYPFPRNVFSPVMWPFTLDYSYTLVCNIQPCPKQTYPGMWVVPVVVMMDYREHLPCAYVDHCTNEPRNQYESFEMLWKNFLRNYRTNRAPVYVNLHSVWLETDFHMEAMDEFIQRLLGMKDVYLLSVHKALEWVSHPTPLSRIMDFKPWQCEFTPNQEDKEFCSFTFRPIKSSTTRRTTTASRTRYHNTAEDQDNDIDDDEERDHNGFAKGEERQTGNMENSRGKGHRHHAHRPWFLRGTAVRFLPPVGVILLLAGLSVLMFVST